MGIIRGRMRVTHKIKTIAAALLIVTFCLPLSKCRKVRLVQSPQTGNREIRLTDPIQQENQHYRYVYAYKEIKPGDPGSWIFAAAFLWPVPVLLYRRYGQNAPARQVLKYAAPFFCLMTGVIVSVLTFCGELLFGGYLALFAAGLYLSASLWEIAKYVREKTRSIEIPNH